MKTMCKEYSVLFNEITDVSEELSKLVKRLTEAQQRTEAMYIEAVEGIYITEQVQD